MAILFDLDDTLLDDRGAQEAYLGDLYSNHRSEIQRTAIDFRSAWRRAIDRHFPRYVKGEITLSEQRRARVRDAFDCPGFSDGAADRVVSEFLAGYEASWRLFPDVLNALDPLRSIPLGIVTNGNSGQQRAKLQRTGILDRFAIVVVSEDVGHAKPSAWIFQHACAGLGIDPMDCVFVGDDWEKDVQGARGAGLRPIWVNRLDEEIDPHRAELPRIKQLSEIVERDDLRDLVGLDRLVRGSSRASQRSSSSNDFPG